jgi:6-phosphofructokinase
MSNHKKRIALTFGSGFVPGLNAVIEGVVLAGHKLGWEILGLYDGFDGLLSPANYPDGGTIKLTSEIVNGLSGSSECILGTSAQMDPFHCRSIGIDNEVEEMDRSDELLGMLKDLQVDAIITVAGNQSMSIPAGYRFPGSKVLIQDRCG